MKPTLIVAALAALPTPAQAKFTFFMNGNDLLAQCQSGNPQERSLCLAYIEGVVDDMNENRVMNGAKTGCPDREHVTAGQFRDAVVNSLMSDPTGRNLEASALVAIAIARAWHCTTNDLTRTLLARAGRRLCRRHWRFDPLAPRYCAHSRYGRAEGFAKTPTPHEL
jgi:hypothetical protein